MKAFRFRIKKYLARGFDRLAISENFLLSQARIYFPFIRAVNYHDIPQSESELFRQHLAYYTQHFSPVNLDDLIQFHDLKVWQKSKPGIILSFDDGYRSNYDVTAPLLEEFGFTGWFFIPPGVIDLPLDQQLAEAPKHRVISRSASERDPRVLLSWEEIIQLDKNHIIGCHTMSHRRLGQGLTEDELVQEISASKHYLEEKLHHEILAFAWVGGEEWSYSRNAARIIQEANYKLVFQSNRSIIKADTPLHLLNRTNVESSFSMPMMKLNVSGFLDMLYWPKRTRINRLVSIETPSSF